MVPQATETHSSALRRFQLRHIHSSGDGLACDRQDEETGDVDSRMGLGLGKSFVTGRSSLWS